MRNPGYPGRQDRGDLGLTPVPLSPHAPPDQARPHHPLVSNRRAELSGALRAEMSELRNRSHDAEMAKTSILANLSHEFRTPLNAIIGFSELLLSDTAGKIENERQREYVGDIHESAHRLLDMVNSLLDTADLTNGLTDLNREPADLIHELSNAYQSVAPLSRARRINLELDADCGSCTAEIDRGRLSHAFRQILVEAIRQTDREGTLVVRFTNTEDAIAFSFSRLASTRPKDDEIPADIPFIGPPTGLVGELEIDTDLSIARLVVELHGGTLRLPGGSEDGLIAEINIPRRAG